jgi:hypothetical protein
MAELGQAADLEQFESERLDLGQHAVQRGLVRDGASQQRVPALRFGALAGERAPHGRTQVAADTDLVAGRRLPVGLLAGHRHTAGPGARVIVGFMWASLTPGGVNRRHTAG